MPGLWTTIPYGLYGIPSRRREEANHRPIEGRTEADRGRIEEMRRALCELPPTVRMGEKESRSQMSFPTHLSPWFVVQRVTEGSQTDYWTTDGEGTLAWTTNPQSAMLFMQLSSAARVADSTEDALVVAVYSKEALTKYRPREFST